jgi:hypothetical protein
MGEVFTHVDQPVRWTSAVHGRPDWPGTFDGYVAAVDWPSVAFWRELAFDEYPDALVLLSTRQDAATWWQSATATIFTTFTGGFVPPRTMADWFDTVRVLFDRNGIDPTDEAAAIAGYDRHVAAVRAEVPPDRLLEWRPGDGWEPICAALGEPVPDEPFPHANSTEDFQARRSAPNGGDEDTERRLATVAQAYRRDAADVDGPLTVPIELTPDGDQVVAVATEQRFDAQGRPAGPPVEVVHRFSFDGRRISGKQVEGRT